MPSNLKVSAEAAATALTGAEFVRVVQGGLNARTTTQEIADLASTSQNLPVTIPYSATLTIDLAEYAYTPFVFDLELTGNVLLDFTNGFDGQVIRARIKQDGTGGRTWTQGSNIRFSDGIPVFVLSTVADRLDYIAFEWHEVDGKADVLAYNRGFA